MLPQAFHMQEGEIKAMQQTKLFLFSFTSLYQGVSLTFSGISEGLSM